MTDFFLSQNVSDNAKLNLGKQMRQHVPTSRPVMSRRRQHKEKALRSFKEVTDNDMK